MEIQTTKNSSIIVADFTTKAPLLEYDYGKYILTILVCFVTPFISLFGLTGNVLSIKILIKDGLHKCSNILLVALAFSDTCFLIGYNSPPKNIYVLHGDRSFQFSEKVSHAMFILHLIHVLLDYGMAYMGLSIPMFITCERLVAVYFPLKFTSIVTPRRTWTLLICLFIYWITYISYTLFWFEFSYTFDSRFNKSVGLIKRSQLFYEDRPKLKVMERIIFSVVIAPALTFVGCALIIIRLRYLSKKRKKMTQTASDKANMKTTQMLLGVCALYLVTCAGVNLAVYMPQEWIAYDLTSENPSILGLISFQTLNILLCINSSWNFIIYVALNKKFRDILKEILFGCCKKKDSI